MRPLTAARDVLQDWQLDARRGERGGAGGSAFHELEDFFDALPLSGADQGHRRSEFTGELGRIHVAAAVLEIVGHVEDDQRRQLQAEDRRGQHKVSAKVGAIQNQQQCVGLGDAGHGSGQDIVGHLLVFRARTQAVNAGQVDQDHFAVMRSFGFVHLGLADALFDGDTGEVRYLLAQAGEAIEERRLAGVGRADDGDHVRTRALVQWRRSYCNSTSVAVVAIAHAAPLDGRKIKRDAVSRRSATSEPSTR